MTTTKQIGGNSGNSGSAHQLKSRTSGLQAAVILRPTSLPVDSTIATVAPFLSFDTDMSPAGWQPKAFHPQRKTPSQYGRGAGWKGVRYCGRSSCLCVHKYFSF